MILRFAKKIYDHLSVTNAIASFKEFAVLEMEDSVKYYDVHFRELLDEDYSEEELAKEFSNYVLSLTILSYVENTI